ncbi:MAG: hypothetical protein Q4D22_04225, partial [Candidatus Saccharibacteria bacterium]|nr:hypothetical protein [Candidatus Saccharibacteria bacterium]
MKRFAILFLVMILMLTACGESGITNTAHADETDNGDEYEDFNQEEGGIDDDAEPQIWLEEGVPYDNPTDNNQNDGWDGVDPNAPVDEKLDMSEIPEGLADGVIYYAHTTVGTIVIHDSAYIYRIVDGEITQVWDYYAEADNVIFDASEY